MRGGEGRGKRGFKAFHWGWLVMDRATPGSLSVLRRFGQGGCPVLPGRPTPPARPPTGYLERVAGPGEWAGQAWEARTGFPHPYKSAAASSARR